MPVISPLVENFWKRRQENVSLKAMSSRVAPEEEKKDEKKNRIEPWPQNFENTQDVKKKCVDFRYNFSIFWFLYTVQNEYIGATLEAIFKVR